VGEVRSAIVEIAVVARASRDEIGPWADGVLRIHVTRPPAGGEANRAVLRLLAHSLGIAPSALELIAGRTGRRKRVLVWGIGQDELERRLSGA